MATKFCGRKILLEFAVGLTIFFDLGSCEPVKIFGLMNNNITLSPLRKAVFKDITWKKGKDKVAELQEGGLVNYFGSFQERATLDQTGNFTILNLTASDEDQYEIESFNPGASETMHLYVLESLPQPHLYCSFDGENFTVWCNGSEGSRFLNYEWKFSGSYVNLSESKVQLRNSGNLHQNITCIIKNPKSTNESSLFLKTCVQERSQERNRFLLIGSVLFLVLCVAVVFRILKT
ncbi:lymphocyte function-associated antigen 3 [Trichosurus vulpecula]|uniref:lymphocyte function-associated antigen 3 n=1 Tax=Trichosurus vulpecula TaxID=9337 RepID=UPI00186AF1D3|nr:lymphocyte function-associated antigen 3 [Trichosurus vulpecula]XP_036625117.1 lymphocyte function-associated antigen 3 [Trichosurus vulpecula]